MITFKLSPEQERVLGFTPVSNRKDRAGSEGVTYIRLDDATPLVRLLFEYDPLANPLDQFFSNAS